MARLQFCDYHNMVAILEKSEHNINFYPIVDFVEASPLRARIAQSLALPPVADEPAFPLRDFSQGEACPTVSSLDVEQDRTNIAKTCTLPHESTSRVTSLAADEGNRGVAEHSEDDAPIKGRRLDVGEEAAERVSDDTVEMATVLTSMDTATVLASGVAEVYTGNGSIPTASPPAAEVPTGSDVVLTAGLIFATAPVVTPYTRRKGKETMVESETPKKKKVQEQIDAQIMIDGLDRNNETVANYMQEYNQFATELPIKRRIELISDLVRNQAGWKAKDFKGMKLKEIKENFDSVWKQIHDFILIGSKEEAKRFKRKGIRFEQESVKKLKASEEVPKEKVKEMMQLVPIEEVYIEALQVNHPIIDWKHLSREDLNELWAIVKESLNIRPASIKWKLYDSCGVHHVTSKDNEIFMLIEKDYPLRKGLAIVMICYKL
nr:hypothetical protein [Tanacetum cinerariifolium]